LANLSEIAIDLSTIRSIVKLARVTLGKQQSSRVLQLPNDGIAEARTDGAIDNTMVKAER
jgi:hypothetical protein